MQTTTIISRIDTHTDSYHKKNDAWDLHKWIKPNNHYEDIHKMTNQKEA